MMNNKTKIKITYILGVTILFISIIIFSTGVFIATDSNAIKAIPFFIFSMLLLPITQIMKNYIIYLEKREGGKK